jgi:hypothetical protein
MEEIESSINRYLSALDAADRQEPTASESSAVRLEEKIAKLKTQMKELQAIEIQLNESPDKQVSLTDPDSRSMMTRGTGIVGYNVQTAVDTQHHLIVAHEVTNVGSDRDQLSSMAKQAREAMASDALSVVADRGYFKSEQILACHDAGITAYVHVLVKRWPDQRVAQCSLRLPCAWRGGVGDCRSNRCSARRADHSWLCGYLER